MFNIEVENPDVMCPNCHRTMVELAKFYHAMHEDGGTMGTEAPLFVGMGFRFGLNPIAVLELLNGLWDLLFLKLRNKKVERLCTEVLPRYPKSLICPNCLYLWRRMD